MRYLIVISAQMEQKSENNDQILIRFNHDSWINGRKDTFFAFSCRAKLTSLPGS